MDEDARGGRDGAGHTLEDMPYWDLFASLRTLPEVGEWGLPYENLGKRDVPGLLSLPDSGSSWAALCMRLDSRL